MIFMSQKLILLSWLLVLLASVSWPIMAMSGDAHAADLTKLAERPPKESGIAMPIEFMNRHIFTIRSSATGYTQEERAISIKQRIAAAMEKGGDDKILVRPAPEDGRIVELNGLAVFQVRTSDIDPLTGETTDELARSASRNLEISVLEAREQLNPQVILRGGGLCTLASVIFILAYRIVRWGERRLIGYLQHWLATHEAKLTLAMQPQMAVNAAIFGVGLVKWTLMMTLGYAWATFSLRQFPYSRPWGETLNSYLIDTIEGLLLVIAGALPGLLVVLLIVIITRYAAQMLTLFFSRVESGEFALHWLDAETAKPTRKISQTLLWLFALAMAYPYLPGSHTEAFKGLSVLVGLMLSIGASGVVGQAASGLIMIYSRALREGEYVKIGDIAGVVTSIGIFSTKIRTSSGEEVNMPNANIVSTNTVNSSRLAEGRGLVLHTSVTIGYNSPWRQVHAMLLSAAERTPGVCAKPKPYVMQTALSDFYVEYRLCVQIERPEIRRVTLTTLHANIQDIFNEFEVQIMSPHYKTDPADKVWVPKEQWFAAPATKIDEHGTD
jgi:small-conductance mechanosensitive channel